MQAYWARKENGNYYIVCSSTTAITDYDIVGIIMWDYMGVRDLTGE